MLHPPDSAPNDEVKRRKREPGQIPVRSRTPTLTNCGLVLSREPSEHGTSRLVREQNPYVLRGWREARLGSDASARAGDVKGRGMSGAARGTVPVRGQGIREIDRQLMYSAAWLDDGRPALVPVARGSQRGGSPEHWSRASSTSSMRQIEEHVDHGAAAKSLTSYAERDREPRRPLHAPTLPA